MRHLNSKLTKILLIVLAWVMAGSALIAAGKVLYRVAVKLEKMERTPALEQETEIRAGRMWMDNLMDMYWQAHEGGFGLKLTNKSDRELVITWKKSWLVDEKGKKRSIIPPSRLAGRAKKTKSTTIPVKGSVNLSISPSDLWTEQKAPVSIEGNKPISGNSSWKSTVFKQVYSDKYVKKISRKYRKKTGKEFDIDTYIAEKNLEVVLNMDIGGTQYCYRASFKLYVFENNEAK